MVVCLSAEAVSVPAANGVIYSASSLPPGVTLDTATGLISGTPTTAGTYNSEITVVDATDSTFQITEALTFSVTASGGVTWNTSAAEFSSLTLTEGTPMSSITLSASGTGTISYADDAMLPAGISLVAGVVSGTPTSSTATETSVTFTATDEDGNSEDLFVSFPEISAGGGTETVEFDTPAGTLATFDAGENINETVDATASQGSAITYTFTATNSANAFGLTGTGISVTGNNISGIAPRLYVAATFTFDFFKSFMLKRL